MKHIQHLFFFFLFSSAFLSLFGHQQTTYVYKKKTGDHISQSTWVVKEVGNEFQVEGKSPGGQTKIISSVDRETKQFTFQSTNNENDYTILRDGSYLIARGITSGHSTEKSFNIGKKLWLQEFDFSLKPFILSNMQSIKFYIVHPKKLSTHYMVAKKKDRESLTLNGKNYDALKVKVTLNGFKSMFWSAQLWFDQVSGDLLKYVANKGPNTPTSTITLLSKEVQ